MSIYEIENENGTRTRVNITVFDTPDDMFEQLARVFDVQDPVDGPNGHRWISIRTNDDIELTFHHTTPDWVSA